MSPSHAGMLSVTAGTAKDSVGKSELVSWREYSDHVLEDRSTVGAESRGRKEGIRRAGCDAPAMAAAMVTVMVYCLEAGPMRGSGVTERVETK